MKNQKHFELTDDQKLKLNQIQVAWRHKTEQIFRKEFGNAEVPNCIVGAGVKIYRKVRNKNYVVANWYGTGQTGEGAAFHQVVSQIHKLGFEAVYSYGRLD